MRSLESRLSKLEALAGVSLSPMEQLDRLAERQLSETLLQVLALIRAQIHGTEPPKVSDDIVALMRRMLDLMAAAA